MIGEERKKILNDELLFTLEHQFEYVTDTGFHDPIYDDSLSMNLWLLSMNLWLLGDDLKEDGICALHSLVNV